MLCRIHFKEPSRLVCSRSQVISRLFSPFRCRRTFHIARPLQAVRPYLLADIGEGITECQIVSWSVKPGDQVQQFDTICEVASDKATVEITSRFDGTVRALHYEENDMAVVGKPLLDIDIADDDLEADELLAGTGDQLTTNEIIDQAEESIKNDIQQPQQQSSSISNVQIAEEQTGFPPAAETNLIATPAVRQLLKQHNVNISDITGTGKGGRVTKEDVERYISRSRHQPGPTQSAASQEPPASNVVAEPSGEDRKVRLSTVQSQMFKVMTRSLSIPHFQYTHSVDVTHFASSSAKLSANKAVNLVAKSEQTSSSVPKLTLLPFIMKALSQVFIQFPQLNSHLDTTTEPNHPTLILKASHDFGIAVDTPQGLLVPVIRQVQNYSIIRLAAEIKRVSSLAREGKLKPEDFQNATFAVSNIGSVGACGAVSPIIVAPMVGILGIGRILDVPVIRPDKITGIEQVTKEQQVVLSWSADHRIIDGATVAKAAEMLGALLNGTDTLGVMLR